ncbi:MAG: hypothetical protein ACE5HI_03995 [bacterium]
MHTFRGYQVRNGQEVIAEGLRANPLIYIGNTHSGISGAVQNFWQNFPTSLEAKGNYLKFGLFPRHFADLHELQGGEQKTHSIYLDFSGDPKALNWVQHSLVLMPTPEWYSESKTFAHLTSDPAYRNEKYEAVINSAVTGDNSFFERREVIDEYGWRNFGGAYADHEAAGHEGSAPLISHYNNQYDLICGCICQYVSKADIAWYELMNDLTHHVIDIDIYHTHQDRVEYNGGMFWHTDHYIDTATCTLRSFSKAHLRAKTKGLWWRGPGLEHNYTTGLLYHYYLTGNMASKETVIELSNWVIRNIERPNTIFGTLHYFKNKLPSWKNVVKGEAVRSDRYLFTRHSGSSINALVDGYSLTGERTYLEKVENIIKHCVHPKDDIKSRNLLDVEPHWSYTVFLQALGKYLDLKLELDEKDKIYWYARASLIHYAKWMLKHEYPYLDKPEKLEYPNETWPAQDMRKCCVFLFAAKHSNGSLRNAFLKKAQYFFEDCIQTLDSFPTKFHTRPIVILLQNGGMYSYFLENLCEAAPSHQNDYSFVLAHEFLTPKLIAKHILSNLMSAAQKTSFKKGNSSPPLSFLQSLKQESILLGFQMGCQQKVDSRLKDFGNDRVNCYQKRNRLDKKSGKTIY